MSRSIRKGDRVIVQFEDGEVEYVIGQIVFGAIGFGAIRITPIDGGDPSVISFNGQDWVIDGHEDVDFRFEPPDIVQQLWDPNVMINILAKMDHPSLNQMCKTNQEINRICQSDEFWRMRLWNDFRFNIPTDKPPKQVYSEIYNTEQTKNTANMAAMNGQLHVLKWLNSLEPPIRPSIHGANLAAGNGHLDVLKWLNSLKPLSESDNQIHLPILPGVRGANLAAESGRLDVLKWLSSFDLPILPDVRGANLAALYGHLHVLKWLNSLEPSIHPDEEGANLAAKYGRSHVVEWLANLEPPILPG